ncbi:MAG: hypothetical protein QXG00_07215 [Candidatus Woesearchaeota archaeon]
MRFDDKKFVNLSDTEHGEVLGKISPTKQPDVLQKIKNELNQDKFDVFLDGLLTLESKANLKSFRNTILSVFKQYTKNPENLPALLEKIKNNPFSFPERESIVKIKDIEDHYKDTNAVSYDLLNAFFNETGPSSTKSISKGELLLGIFTNLRKSGKTKKDVSREDLSEGDLTDDKGRKIEVKGDRARLRSAIKDLKKGDEAIREISNIFGTKDLNDPEQIKLFNDRQINRKFLKWQMKNQNKTIEDFKKTTKFKSFLPKTQIQQGSFNKQVFEVFLSFLTVIEENELENVLPLAVKVFYNYKTFKNRIQQAEEELKEIVRRTKKSNISEQDINDFIELGLVIQLMVYCNKEKIDQLIFFNTKNKNMVASESRQLKDFNYVFKFVQKYLKNDFGWSASREAFMCSLKNV